MNPKLGVLALLEAKPGEVTAPMLHPGQPDRPY
jgi:hypothetical protein